MTAQQNKFQEGLNKAWKDYLQAQREKKYPNIMLLGISGAGKSSLVNYIFETDEAKTSNVAPETKGYCNFYDGHKYETKINLIDTAGYELDRSESYYASIAEALHSKYDGEPIHVLWYCLSVGNERIEEIDLRVLRSLMEMDGIKDRLCIVFTHCDLDDNESSKLQAFRKVLQNNGLNGLPSFEASIDPRVESQLCGLIQWSTEQLKDEDFRQSFVGSQMVDLELKKKEAEKITNNACLAVAALRVSEMLRQDDKKKALAEHQMNMIINIFSVYGIDCLAGLTKKFEKTTSFVEFGNGVVSVIIDAIPKAERFREYMKTAAVTGLTKAVGSVASKISYSYVEKHIKGIPVKLEKFYTDPNSAGIIAALLDDAISATGNKLQEKFGGREEKAKGKAVSGKSLKKK